MSKDLLSLKNRRLAWPTVRLIMALVMAFGVLVGVGAAVQTRAEVLQDPARVYVDPVDQRVSRDTTFEVAVAIEDPGVELTAYDFMLKFNPDVVQVLGVEDARFEDPLTAHRIDNDAGEVDFGALITPEMEEEGSDASGILAVIQFEAAERGTSGLELIEVNLVPEPADVEWEDGSVTSAFDMEIVPSHPERWVNPGVFTETVMIHGARDLATYQFRLAFNDEVVTVTDVTDLGFLESTGNTNEAETFEVQDGILNFGVVADGPNPGPNGDGELAVITFEAIGLGNSDLDLFELLVSDTEEGAEEPDDLDGLVHVVPSQVFIWPDESSVNRCDTLEIDVMIVDAVDLAGYEFRFEWNDDVFNVLSVEDGGFLESAGRTLQGETLEMGDGTLRFGVTSSGAEGAEGDGVLATITLEAMNVGVSDLELFDVLLVDTADEGMTPTTEDGWAEATKEAVEFEFDAIADQVAGEPFDVTITALNEDGDPAVNFSGMVDLSDTTGTLSPTQVEFDGPEATASMTITKAEEDITITAEAVNPCGVDIDGESNAFTVEPDVESPDPDTAVLTPDPETVTAGDSVAYTLMVDDIYGNPFHAEDMATFGIDAEAGGSFDGNVYTSEFAGTWTVTADYLIVSEEATLTVEPDVDNPVAVTIEPDEVSLMIGECQTFTLTGEDAYGNTFDVTDSADTSFEVDGGGVVTDNEFCSDEAGVWTVTGTYLTESDDATVTVEPFRIFMPIVAKNYTPVSYVQVAHLAPFAENASVTIRLNGVDALTDVGYGDSTAYIELDPGEYLVQIIPSGSATVAIEATVDLEAGVRYTAIAVGDGVNQDLELIALEDDLTPPAAGQFHLRLGHLAPFTAGAATADVRLQDGTPVLENVDFGDITGFIPLAAGEYDLKITTPGGATTLIDPPPVTFTAGQIVSAFATGDGVNQDLGVFALPAGAPGFFVFP